MGIAAIENQQDSVQVHLCHDKYIQWLHIFNHVQEINFFFCDKTRNFKIKIEINFENVCRTSSAEAIVRPMFRSEHNGL